MTTNNITPPTCSDLFSGKGFERIRLYTDSGSRHGMTLTEVYRRMGEGTYWRAVYDISGDGEEHGLRDGSAEITRVYPHEVTTIEWREAP